jgi:hypothetical protein
VEPVNDPQRPYVGEYWTGLPRGCGGHQGKTFPGGPLTSLKGPYNG